SQYSPMEGNNWQSGVTILGRRPTQEFESSSWNRIGPRYFETLGTRVLRGRTIDERRGQRAARRRRERTVRPALLPRLRSDRPALRLRRAKSRQRLRHRRRHRGREVRGGATADAPDGLPAVAPGRDVRRRVVEQRADPIAE